jgi:hypothetical protein
MARPITPTPKLNLKESQKFLKKIDKDLKSPLRLVPTPKLQKARELLKYGR